MVITHKSAYYYGILVSNLGRVCNTHSSSGLVNQTTPYAALDVSYHQHAGKGLVNLAWFSCSRGML